MCYRNALTIAQQNIITFIMPYHCIGKTWDFSSYLGDVDSDWCWKIKHQ